jgi:hypothetical protein
MSKYYHLHINHLTPNTNGPDLKPAQSNLHHYHHFTIIKSKGKYFSLRAIKTYRGRRGTAPPFLTSALILTLLEIYVNIIPLFKEKNYKKISYHVITRPRDGLFAVRFPAKTSGFSPRRPVPPSYLTGTGVLSPVVKRERG